MRDSHCNLKDREQSKILNNACPFAVSDCDSVMETQAATSTASGAVPGPAVYTKAAMHRTGDGGVALGLFSKIAAARKEQLAPYVRAVGSLHATLTGNSSLLVLGHPAFGCDWQWQQF